MEPDVLESTEIVYDDDASKAATERKTEERGYRRTPVLSESLIKRAANMIGACYKEGGTAGMRARADLMDAMTGRLHVSEAFTTSDFQWAAWIVLDRETITQYQERVPEFQNWTDSTRVRDFRKKELVDFTQTPFTLEKVGELAPYPAQDRTGGFKAEVQAAKYGRRYALSWESMINDQLDELTDLPQALATAAREAETFNALSLLLNMTGPTTASGPNLNFFKNYTGVWSSSNPFAGVNTTPATVPLTYTNLYNAINAIRIRRNPNPKMARPITLPGRFQLIVPVELQTQAEAIMDLEWRETVEGAVTVREGNRVRNLVDLRVEPWLSFVDTHAKAATTWYLLPPRGSAYKAIITASLIGHETPELRVKADTGQSVGGGAINPQDGSFDIDDIQYRVRHVMGGTTFNPLATYVSLGS